jgi:hypothetical protein
MNVDGPTEIVLFRDPPGHRSAGTSTGRAESAEYLRARLIAERAAAKLATSPEARVRHEELVRAYDGLARKSESGANR